MVPSKRPVMQTDYSPVEAWLFIDLITKDMFTFSLFSEIKQTKKNYWKWRWAEVEVTGSRGDSWHTCGWQRTTGEFTKFGSAVEGSTKPVLSVATLFCCLPFLRFYFRLNVFLCVLIVEKRQQTVWRVKAIDSHSPAQKPFGSCSL